MENPYTILPKTIILAPLSCFSKKRLFEELGESAGCCLGIDGREISRALAQREALGTTYVGNGTAVPHAVFEGSKEAAVLALLNKPVAFNGIDSEEILVDTVFAFCFALKPESKLTEDKEMFGDHLVRLLSQRELTASLRLSRHDSSKIAGILKKVDAMLFKLMTGDHKSPEDINNALNFNRALEDNPEDEL